LSSKIIRTDVGMNYYRKRFFFQIIPPLLSEPRTFRTGVPFTRSQATFASI